MDSLIDIVVVRRCRILELQFRSAPGETDAALKLVTVYNALGGARPYGGE